MHGHLVPGLVHLPAVDAPDREHVEDRRCSSRSRSPRDGMPSTRDPAAVAPCWRSSRAAPPGCPTSRGRCRTLRSSPARAGRRRGRARAGRPRASRPSARARSSRYGLRSVTTTWRAPAWRTTAAAMQPIGPAPVISTSSPSTGNWSAVWTAFPNGSKIAATSASMPSAVVPDVRHRQRDQLGERARPVDADAARVRAQVAAAGHAVAAAAADDVALAADDVAGVEVAHVRPDRDDLADELVADRHRHRDRLLRPGVPLVDVQVGAADAGAADADQDVVDAVLRLRARPPATGPARRAS